MTVPQWVIDMEDDTLASMSVNSFGFANGKHPEYRPDEPIPACFDCGHSRHRGPCLGTHIQPAVPGLRMKAVCTPCGCSATTPAP